MMTVIDNKTGRARGATGHAGTLGGLWSRLLARRQGPSADSLASLYPVSEDGGELYELRLESQGHEWAKARGAGTVARLVVERGSLEVTVGKERYRLEEGDAYNLAADQAHAYRNTGRGEAVAYYVMTYGNPPNRF